MAAGSYSTSFYRGETFYRTFTLTASGSAVDLTGYTFEMALRQANSSSVAYTWTSYFTIPTPANGTAVLTVPDTITALVTKGRYEYDIKYTDGSGVVKYLLAGTLDALTGVTP